MYGHACWLHSLENWATVDSWGEGVEGLKGAEMQAMLLLFQAYPLPCRDTRFTLWRPGPWGAWVLPGKSPSFYTDQELWSLESKHSHHWLDGSLVHSKPTLWMLNLWASSCSMTLHACWHQTICFQGLYLYKTSESKDDKKVCAVSNYGKGRSRCHWLTIKGWTLNSISAPIGLNSTGNPQFIYFGRWANEPNPTQ